MWIAKRRMTIGGKTRMPGEPVPEASTWKYPEKWEASGHIRHVPDSMSPAPTSGNTDAQPSDDAPQSSEAATSEETTIEKIIAEETATEEKPKKKRFMYKCDHCGISFETGAGLSRHKMKNHG